ncbi:MAG: 50S ribosomal protein L25/general stress protein Ctc [Alphaproteobacteria bacterium]
MSEVSTLPVQGRERSGKGGARAARRAGLVPGIVYGAGEAPTMVAMETRVLMKELRNPGYYSHIRQIELDGSAVRVLPREVQFHPVTDVATHFDLQRVSADATIAVAVPVRFLNEELSPGLKQGGVLNVVRHEVELMCPVDAIPEHVEIDLQGFSIGDSIHFSQVVDSASLRPTITDRDFTVATIAPPTVARAATDEAEEEADEE